MPRFGNSAVERNRVKRRLRELIRLELLPGTPPLDMLIRASKSAYGLSFGAMRGELLRLSVMIRDAQVGSG